MPSFLHSFLCLALCCTSALAQVSQSKASKNEFPALPLLPAGSEIKGILLPRYEGRRVSTLIKIGLLKVDTATKVEVREFAAMLYDEAGNTTRIATPLGRFNFETARVSSAEGIEMDDPRFSARGRELHLDTKKKVGVLRGPVRTVIPASQNYSK